MAWEEAPLVCSPFIALSWPLLIASKIWSLCAGFCIGIGIGRSRVRIEIDDASADAGKQAAGAPPRSRNASRRPSREAAGSAPKPTPVAGSGHPPPVAGSTPPRVKVSPPGSPQGEGGSASKLSRRSGHIGREAERKASNRQGTTRSLLTSVGARQSQEEATGSDGAQQSWTKQQEVEICDLLMNWILDHEDEVNQSERWRTQMQKKNAKRFDKVDKGVNSIAASLKEIKKNQLSSRPQAPGRIGR